jgi:ornithine lipid ester-linked acyl 2-hydroxylase
VQKAAATCFHNTEHFAFIDEVRARWREIHNEYLGVREQLIDWFERDLYGDGWKVFGLYDFPHGNPVAGNVGQCPVTAELVARHVPRHGAAGFSVLKPGTRIQPHRGYPGQTLRCHLGLDVPEGDCGIRVGGETRRWRAGEALVLDDRLEHEAWNLTSQERVVLLFDFIPGGAAA